MVKRPKRCLDCEKMLREQNQSGYCQGCLRRRQQKERSNSAQNRKTHVEPKRLK